MGVADIYLTKRDVDNINKEMIFNRILNEHINRLLPFEREVIVAYYFNNLTITQIIENTKLSEKKIIEIIGNTRSYIHKLTSKTVFAEYKNLPIAMLLFFAMGEEAANIDSMKRRVWYE